MGTERRPRRGTSGTFRRRWLWLGVVPLVGGVALVALLATRPHHAGAIAPQGNRTWSRLAPGPAVQLVSAPGSYQITYRSDGGPRGIVSTVVLSVRRPFDAREETRPGPPPGTGPASSVLIESLGRYQQGALLLAVPPGPASLDQRPEAVLDELVSAGRMTRRERREVAGRPCQVYRSGTDPTTGAPGAWRAGQTTWTDLCLDAGGLVLEDVNVAKGVVTQRRVATDVKVGLTLDDGLFRTEGNPVPVQKGGGAFAQLVPSSRLPQRFFDLPSPPAGFVHLGRYLSRPPQPELVNNINRERDLLGGVNDVYVDGSDFLVIDQGATLGGDHPFEPDPTATPVQLGSLGSGDLILSLSATVVRVDLGHGSYVRVAGTLPSATLVAVARSLIAGPGGSLTVATG